MAKTIGLVVIGQSNEQGSSIYASGGPYAYFTSAYGWPNNDTQTKPSVLDTGSQIYSSGWHGSAFTILAEMLSVNRRISAMVHNCAQGGTGVVDQWAGMLSTWNANYGYKGGCWVLPTTPNGFKYKNAAAGGTQAASGASEPVWGTSVGGSTVDGGITWTCAAADASDTAGRVYTAGTSGYDPLGYIANVKNRIAALGTTETWVLIAGGQSDLDGRPKTLAQRTSALTALVDDLLTNTSANLALGTTCYWNDATQGPKYATVLEPSRQAALVKYAGNPRVIAGANLYDALGTGVALANESGTLIHMQPSAVRLAADAWYTSLVASGRF